MNYWDTCRGKDHHACAPANCSDARYEYRDAGKRFLGHDGSRNEGYPGRFRGGNYRRIEYLGIRNGRDDATHKTSGGGSVAVLCEIYAATGMIYAELPVVDLDSSSLGGTKAEWDQFAACGAMVAGEGPNEPNNFAFTYKGLGCNGNTMIGCAAFMKDLYNLIHTDQALTSLKLWGQTEVGQEQENEGLQFLTVPADSGLLAAAGTRFADVANTHNYIHSNGPTGKTSIDNQVRLAETITAGPWDTIGEYSGSTWSRDSPALPPGGLHP